MRALKTLLFTSAAALLFASIANAGSITGSVATPPTNVNLATEGTSDWVHWGLNVATDVNHKSTGGSQIGALTLIGAGSTKARLSDSPSKYSWTSGTPTATANTSPTGVYITKFDGPGRGFQFTAPADLDERTLEVFLGEFDASGTLEASLTDNSADVYTSVLAGLSNQTVQGMYTLKYKADSPNQTLTIKWTETADLGAADNVTLQGAALRLSAVPEPTTLACGFAALALTVSLRRKK